MTQVRTDWTLEEIQRIYYTPLMDLIHQAATTHRQFNDAAEVQMCTLLSIKTGGCPEDCSYCPQAARYSTDVESHKLMETGDVLEAAQKAKIAGSSRFCMGAAWRNVKDNEDFDHVLEMVKGVNNLGMEVCCTLGMLTKEQARKLSDAGLYAYNHNLDTSESYYSTIISTRKYEDRLDTIKNVQSAGISVCSGGIIGMGETHKERIGMLHTLSTLDQHPESVPVNALVPVKGTPLEQQPRVSTWDMVRMIATARILMPKSVIRLSAGRTEMGLADQALCFMAGANSIFTGEKLLTTPNPEFDQDHEMFDILGLNPRPAFKETTDSIKIPEPQNENTSEFSSLLQ